MTDKHRHRHFHAPRGYLPNWALVSLAICAMVVVGIAQTIA